MKPFHAVYSIRPVQAWNPDTAYRILRNEGAGRPRTDLGARFAKPGDAVVWLIDQGLISAEEIGAQ